VLVATGASVLVGEANHVHVTSLDGPVYRLLKK
jgi:hypothetical protein